MPPRPALGLLKVIKQRQLQPSVRTLQKKKSVKALRNKLQQHPRTLGGPEKEQRPPPQPRLLKHIGTVVAWPQPLHRGLPPQTGKRKPLRYFRVHIHLLNALQKIQDKPHKLPRISKRAVETWMLQHNYLTLDRQQVLRKPNTKRLQHLLPPGGLVLQARQKKNKVPNRVVPLTHNHLQKHDQHEQRLPKLTPLKPLLGQVLRPKVLLQLRRGPPPGRLLKQVKSNLRKRPLRQLKPPVPPVAQLLGTPVQLKVDPTFSTTSVVGFTQQRLPLKPTQPAQLLGQNVAPLRRLAQRLPH